MREVGGARIRTRSAPRPSLSPAGMEVQPGHLEVPQPPHAAVFWGPQKDPRPRDVPAEEPGFPTAASATPSPERRGLAASSLGDLAFPSSCDRLGAESLSLPVALGATACWEGRVGVRWAEGSQKASSLPTLYTSFFQGSRALLSSSCGRVGQFPRGDPATLPGPHGAPMGEGPSPGPSAGRPHSPRGLASSHS